MLFRGIRTWCAGLAALFALAVPAGAEAADRYVALGDSYSSGVGTRDYSYNAPCERGPLAYPAIIDRRRPNTVLRFRACGGATTGDVLSRQVSSLTRGTALVTISIGGNDAGFGSVVRQCAKPWPTTCWGDIDRAERYIREELPGRLDGVYSTIRRRSPKALVAVVGYPRIFNEGDECNMAGRISRGEQERLNDVGDLLAVVTRGRAHAHGFGFVDPRRAFVGHAVCDRDEWINGVSDPVSDSYHPNRRGHAAYAILVRRMIG